MKTDSTAAHFHSRPSASRIARLAALFAPLVSLPALALVQPEPSSVEKALRPPVWILEKPEDPMAPVGAKTMSLDSDSVISRAVERFRVRAGGRWTTPVDRRTGRAALFQGSGIPMLPGSGNTLKRSEVAAGVLQEDGAPTVVGVERLVRGFFEENGDLFLPRRGELVLSPDRSGVFEAGRVVYADFDWVVDGVPVLGAQAFARINSGNLIQAGTRLIGSMDAVTTPRIGAAEALARALEHAGLKAKDEAAADEGESPNAGVEDTGVDDEGTEGAGAQSAGAEDAGATLEGIEEIVESGRLVILPRADQPAVYEGPVGGGVSYRLVWEVAFRSRRGVETWTARVDALTGAVLEFFDANAYAGQVTGGVNPRTVTDPETVWPFPMTSVSGPSMSVESDINGRFPLSPGPIFSGLDGARFNTNCEGCTSPAQPGITRTEGTGLFRFGTGGLDATGNGVSTRADRNAFYHLNLVRLLAKKWLAVSYLEMPLPANVNIVASCNAFYNGSSVNFYRSSASCNNTGEIADVMQHEWGHGLDLTTAAGDGATGEGTADTVAIHMTHSPLIGPYFRRDGSPVRNVDKSTSSLQTLTRTNVFTKCGPGPGAQGRAVHCEGQIYGQTVWDLAGALVAKYGANTGWRESERIFFTALPQSTIYMPNQSGSIYDAYIAADDDDGNLANGTPNGAEIYTAFNTHEIAGTPRSSSPHCVRPAQPVVTATAGCDQISLSWNAVPGAASYRVQKHWQTVPSPFLNVATVTGTTYVDTQVTAGATYHYVVQAVDGPGCESSINTEVLAAPTSRPRLDISSLSFDDTPAGNRTGTIDPGESIDLDVTLDNAGNVAATGIGNSLSSATPGVTVIAATSSFPNLAAGGSAPASSAYRIAVGSGVACSTPIVLNLSTTAQGNSCPLETNVIQLEMGTQSAVLYHDFEIPQGWTHDAAASSATTGGWQRGQPNPTSYQPGEDVTPTGTGCWFTAQNGTLDSTEDVDDGQVVLLSPVMDFSNLGGARVRYWRWFGQRDLGDDPSGDFFTVEVSNNGGTSWTTIETVGDNTNAAAWTPRDYSVNALLPLTSTMRFRVRVSDAVRAGDDGDIIEGAIDDFRITGYTCDPTPPCFVGPSFAGLASAAAGETCGGVELSWPAAESHCVNAEITYNVHRSTTAGFTPDPSNRIAEGVTALGFLDSQLTLGATYYYIVRANDSRSGEDANAVIRSAVAAGGVDAEAPVFPGVGASGSGFSCGETTLSWTPAQENCSNPVQYLVHRSINPSFVPSPANLFAEVTSTSYVDAALIPGAVYAYVVRARDDAGNAEGNIVKTFAGANQAGGCSGCPAQAPVGRILVRKSGNDVVLDWTADPVSAARYIAYRVRGPSLDQATRIGSTLSKIFTHESAALIEGPIFYFVSAVNGCGGQSAIDTEP